jgi:hypothetical protein
MFANDAIEDGERGDAPDDTDGDTSESADNTPPEGPIDTSTPTLNVDKDQLRNRLAGSGSVLDARVDAICAMYEYLHTNGSAEKSDLVAEVDIEATAYASDTSLWANMVKGKDTLAGCPGVEAPGDGMSQWRYTAE